MNFFIHIKVGWKTHRIRVIQTPVDDRTEHYCIMGNDRSVTVECNRPFFRNRGLMHRRPEWKIVEGKVQDNTAFREVINEILKVVDKS